MGFGGQQGKFKYPDRAYKARCSLQASKMYNSREHLCPFCLVWNAVGYSGSCTGCGCFWKKHPTLKYVYKEGDDMPVMYKPCPKCGDKFVGLELILDHDGSNHQEAGRCRTCGTIAMFMGGRPVAPEGLKNYFDEDTLQKEVRSCPACYSDQFYTGRFAYPNEDGSDRPLITLCHHCGYMAEGILEGDGEVCKSCGESEVRDLKVPGKECFTQICDACKRLSDKE